MAVETDTERAFFLSTNDFGTAVTYTPNGGGGSTINVIFDNAYVSIEDGGVGLSTTSPQVWCLTSDVSSIGTSDTFTISGTTYNVKDFQSDGQGMTFVLLEGQ